MVYVPEHPFVPLTPEVEAADLVIRDQMIDSSTQLCWYDPDQPSPETIHNGTCFFMKCADSFIGVTAAHVYKSFERRKIEIPNTVSALGNHRFDVTTALIDCDVDLDIVTFALSNQDMVAMRKKAFDCRGSWPPPVPAYRSRLHLLGYPQVLRWKNERWDQRMEWSPWGGVPVVEHVTDKDIPMSYEPERDKAFGGIPAPPVGLNLSGASGGIVLGSADDGRLVPVAIVIVGANKQAEDERVPDRGAAKDFDTMNLRRIHFIGADGKINNPFVQSGWLPSPLR